ncbi:unnamed protein product [Moneuplotes crassus]|uniref:Protein kinase domain-containing protein n=1 Tax=Euplotes crassus TaxID=5936 RepID=A0AAD1XJS0_EUPCR|nr:unnamed protein product [Moneuplotes crassus]
MGAVMCGCNSDFSQGEYPQVKSKSTILSTKRLLPGGKTPIWTGQKAEDIDEVLSTSLSSAQSNPSNLKDLLNVRREPITKFYKVGKIVGLSFSTIIREGFDLRNFERKVSIRTLEWESINSNPEDYMDVLRKQKKIDHPNICGVEEYFSDKDFLYVITENPDGIYLKDFIASNALSDECVVVIVHQIFEAVKYLHSCGFYKSNITINSIKIDPDSLQIKLENFDLPYQFNGLKSKFIDYNSNSRITRKAILDDLHSIGVITSEISSHKDEITLDFIQKCCGESKGSRVTLEEALSHGFFYFRSSKTPIYDDSTRLICSLSSVHDSGYSEESSLYLF